VLDRPRRRAPEREFENTLRPGRLAEFVGQRQVVENLRVALEAARGAGRPSTTCSSRALRAWARPAWRASSRRARRRTARDRGPALDRPRDLVGILTQLGERDVLFIDEVHRIPAAVEEYLYTAMEDFTVDFTLDQGAHARVLPLPLQHFTLVGATTREGLLSAPFRGRFGLLERLVPYPDADLVEILARSAGILGSASRARRPRSSRHAAAERRASPTASCAVCAISRR
jgi:Holliday junction DNA helicase RuvB